MFKHFLVVFTVCVGSIPFHSATLRAEEWATPVVGTAKLSQSASLPPIYNPSLTVKQYNQLILSRDTASELLVEAKLPKTAIGYKHLIGRSVRFEADGKVYSGTVQAAFLNGSGARESEVLLQCVIENSKAGASWALQGGESGKLSVVR